MSLATQILLVNALAGARAIDPAAAEDLTIDESEVTAVEASWSETVVHSKPWIPSKRVGTIKGSTRLAVRGVVKSRDKKGCKGKDWYAVHPMGFVCSNHVQPTNRAPSAGIAVPVGKGKRLPHSYVFVRDEGLSMYASIEDISLGQEKRPLEKGMSLVVARTVDVDGVDYVQTKDGDFVKKSGVRWGGQGSDWSGVVIMGEHEPGPSFGWISHAKTPVLDAPDRGATRIDKLDKRQRVALHESKSVGGRRWVRIGPDRWIEADKVNEVVFIEPPRGVVPTERLERTDNDQWIDVNVGEQVLVAYRGRRPVYATLVSTGRGHKTPLGNYPIWAKVASTDMANQPYEDNPYLVQGVPWVLFFQGDNALHGAYWHNSFGRKKSHGCVNLAPMDARWVFEWVTPVLPAGWTGYLPVELRQDGVVVHVRDTSLGPGLEFTQERRIGPPDPAEEKRRTEEAEARRAAAAAAAGTTWGGATASNDPANPDLPTAPDPADPGAKVPGRLEPEGPPPAFGPAAKDGGDEPPNG